MSEKVSETSFFRYLRDRLEIQIPPSPLLLRCYNRRKYAVCGTFVFVKILSAFECLNDFSLFERGYGFKLDFPSLLVTQGF